MLKKKWLPLANNNETISEAELETMKLVAEHMAVETGNWIKQQDFREKAIQYKLNHVDLVTEIDQKSERRIIEKIERIFESHSIISEESARVEDYANLEQNNNFCWVIDPLDGTTNFVHGLPHYSVSIAVVRKGVPIIGVVYQPNTEELFSAVRGKGTYLNGKRCIVSKTGKLKHSLLNTGFCAEDWTVNNPLQYEYQKAYGRCRSLRISGSAALDLAYLADGRIDGFWQQGLKPWDIAAGILLVEEAGGSITGYDGQRFSFNDCSLIASNMILQSDLSELIHKKEVHNY